MCSGHLTINKLIVVFFEFSREIYQGQLTGITGFGKHTLTTLKEKDLFLNYAADNNVLLLLEHDSVNEVVSLKRTEKGVRVNQILKCNDVF